MKNIKYLIYLSMLTLGSCGGVKPDVQMDKIMEKVYIGMPESEFKEKIVGEENVKMDKTISIYKVTASYYNFMMQYGLEKTRFFYFTDNKLEKVDEGERALDYRIKID